MPRIKLAYPKIPDSRAAPLEKCIAFEKYDGTNLHWVWEPELGWYAFGTRRNRFDLDDQGIAAFTEDHPELAQAPALFLDEFAAPLQSTLLSRPDFATREVTVFTEFLGSRSFAGRHNADDDKQLILFDVAIENQLLDPAQFLEDFGHLPVAHVVYRGRFTGQFTSDVRAGKYAVAEGVICKGGTGPSLWMAKIKTDAYLARLQTTFADNWEQYWE